MGKVHIAMESAILYVGGLDFPDGSACAHRMINNAKLFKALGYNVTLIGYSHKLEKPQPILETKYEYEGFNIYEIPYPKTLKDWCYHLTDKRDILKVADSIDNLKQIICYNYPAIALERIRKASLRRRIKCYSDCTEWYSGAGRSVPVKIFKGIDTFLRMRVVQKKLSGNIVISKYLENYYKNANAVNIPPLTDLQDYNCDFKYRAENESLNLIYAGSPGSKDRIDLLIEALQFVKRRVVLRIVGIEKDEYLKLYPKHGEKGYLGDNIVFMGRKTHEETLEYTLRSDFTCFFRLDNRLSKAGFPTKFAESISLGVPVITNRTSNLEDYIQHGVNGVFVNNLDVHEIAEVIEHADAAIKVDRTTFHYMNYKDKAMTIFENKEY